MFKRNKLYEPNYKYLDKEPLCIGAGNVTCVILPKGYIYSKENCLVVPVYLKIGKSYKSRQDSLTSIDKKSKIFSPDVFKYNWQDYKYENCEDEIEYKTMLLGIQMNRFKKNDCLYGSWETYWNYKEYMSSDECYGDMVYIDLACDLTQMELSYIDDLGDISYDNPELVYLCEVDASTEYEKEYLNLKFNLYSYVTKEYKEEFKMIMDNYKEIGLKKEASCQRTGSFP